MRVFATAAAILVSAAPFLSGPAAAADFSEGSEAKEWGLIGEKKARFTARVVDILCELGGDCPAECVDVLFQVARCHVIKWPVLAVGWRRVLVFSTVVYLL